MLEICLSSRPALSFRADLAPIGGDHGMNGASGHGICSALVTREAGERETVRKSVLSK